MSSEALKYRATSVIEGEIYCSLDVAEQTEGNIELFEDKQEGYQIFAGLSSSSGKTLSKHLMLEQVFYSKQDCGDFCSYAQERRAISLQAFQERRILRNDSFCDR